MPVLVDSTDPTLVKVLYDPIEQKVLAELGCPTRDITMVFDDSDFSLRGDCVAGNENAYLLQLANPIGGTYTVPADIFPECYAPICVWDTVFSSPVIVQKSTGCTGTFDGDFVTNIVIGRVSGTFYVWIFAGLDLLIIGGAQVGYFGFLFYGTTTDISMPIANTLTFDPISIDNDFFKYAEYCGEDHTTFGAGIGMGGSVTLTLA